MTDHGTDTGMCTWPGSSAIRWADHGDWVVNPEQLAAARHAVASEGRGAGNRVVDLSVAGGISLRVLVDRGLDLGAAWFGGVPLAWVSVVGDARPLQSPRGDEWITAFGGGMLTTCGLRNVGAASEGHGLHGSVSHLPGEDVEVSRHEEAGQYVLEVCGRLRDVGALGPHLVMARRIRTWTGSGRVEIEDVTTNLGPVEEIAPLLYHVNIGAPLWGAGARLQLDSIRTIPRDQDAELGVREWERPPTPEPGAKEQVFEHHVEPDHDGWARAVVTQPALGIAFEVAWETSQLPRLHQWRHPGAAVLGIEPANCSVGGRAADRSEGRSPILAAGAARATRLSLRAWTT